MRFALVSAFLSEVIIAGCMPDNKEGTASVSIDAARSAMTTDALLAMGGHRLSDAEFRAELVDTPLRGDNWIWHINGNGTHSSVADDGSWTDQGGTWRLKNGQYCRVGADGGAEKCSAVYKLGSVYRFTETGVGGKLAGWSATRS
ncbi:MAG: hypothetical protein KDK08_25490 [Rhizobiaceae bacterium]|nr:hypothetical protein [Rhizobiaceae bacterium]